MAPISDDLRAQIEERLRTEAIRALGAAVPVVVPAGEDAFAGVLKALRSVAEGEDRKTIERLSAEVHDLRVGLDATRASQREAMATIERMRGNCANLERALGFYADAKNWKRGPGGTASAAQVDKGAKARAALPEELPF